MRDTGKALEENSKKRGKAITDTDIVKAITGAGKGQARQGPLSAQPWSPTLSQQETGGDRDLVAKHQVCRHKEAHEDHEQHDHEEQNVVPGAHAQQPNLGAAFTGSSTYMHSAHRGRYPYQHTPANILPSAPPGLRGLYYALAPGWSCLCFVVCSTVFYRIGLILPIVAHTPLFRCSTASCSAVLSLVLYPMCSRCSR